MRTGANVVVVVVDVALTFQCPVRLMCQRSGHLFQMSVPLMSHTTILTIPAWKIQGPPILASSPQRERLWLSRRKYGRKKIINTYLSVDYPGPSIRILDPNS